MSLRQKFGALALIYVLSLSANLVTSAWCIVVYFRSALLEYRDAVQDQGAFEQLRAMLRDQVRVLRAASGDTAARFAELQDRFAHALAETEVTARDGIGPARWQKIRTAAEDWRAAAKARIDSLGNPEPAPLDLKPIEGLDHHLTEAGLRSGTIRHRRVDAAAETQQRVILILAINAVIGVVLCGLGVFSVRRWVIQPVAELRRATHEISMGNYAHRIRPHSRDELGLLATEVNQMSATIVEMRQHLAEQERLAAAGEMVSRLVHNIRNPLAGIRGLAEGTAHLHPNDTEINELQRRIINTVDRFEKWLRDLQHSVSPLQLNPRTVSPKPFLDEVLAALAPMAERRGIALEAHVDDRVPEICVDPVHFEQALVSLVTNAVQASRKGQTVRVRVSREGVDQRHWRLSVQDDGTGIPEGVQSKIFEPYFTTKFDGYGLGLAMVSKVVKLHGGTLSVRSAPGQGSEFSATIPLNIPGG